MRKAAHFCKRLPPLSTQDSASLPLSFACWYFALCSYLELMNDCRQFVGPTLISAVSQGEGTPIRALPLIGSMAAAICEPEIRQD